MSKKKEKGEGMSGKVKKMNRFQKEFSKGYAHAVANSIRIGCGTLSEARELYNANFLSLNELEEIGVDEYDIYVLKPLIDEIERRNEFWKNKKGNERMKISNAQLEALKLIKLKRLTFRASYGSSYLSCIGTKILYRTVDKLIEFGLVEKIKFGESDNHKIIITKKGIKYLERIE